MRILMINMLVIAICALTLVILTNTLQEDFKMYRAESACVSKYIVQGIERKNIVTENGGCYVKPIKVEGM